MTYGFEIHCQSTQFANGKPLALASCFIVGPQPGPESDIGMSTRRYLLADVGATHTRLGLAGPAGLQGQAVRLATVDIADGAGLLAAAQQWLDVRDLSGACFALAGPVEHQAGALTNGGLRLDAADLARQLGCPVRLVNDFSALALSLPMLQSLRQIGGHASPALALSDVKVVLGPGSGLGMGILIPESGGWRALASEGGHGDLAPGSHLEMELLALLQAEHGHVSWESVLSGPGLVRLYQGVCALWGVRAETVTPEWISASGVDAAEPVCHQTLEVFFGLLGAAAGNLALVLGAKGGVYIGGGIVPQLADFAAASPLRRRFEERGPLSGYVADIPLWIIMDPEPGLLGALECLRGAPGP